MNAVDEYLAAVPEPQRSTLETVRRSLRGLLPEAQETIAYGVPVFKVDGVGVAGYSASKKHCSYLPMSGSVLTMLAQRLDGYQWSKGALRFAVDEPLPDDLLRELVQARLEEIASSRA